MVQGSSTFAASREARAPRTRSPPDAEARPAGRQRSPSTLLAMLATPAASGEGPPAPAAAPGRGGGGGAALQPQRVLAVSPSEDGSFRDGGDGLVFLELGERIA